MHNGVRPYIAYWRFTQNSWVKQNSKKRFARVAELLHFAPSAMQPLSVFSQRPHLIGCRPRATSFNSRHHRSCTLIAPRPCGQLSGVQFPPHRPFAKSRPDMRARAVLQDAPGVNIQVKNDDDPVYTVIDVEGNRSVISRDSA